MSLREWRVCSFRLIAAMMACSCAACPSAAPSGSLPAPDRAMFDAEVYPLLLHDCAFSECHGAPHRFFQVFGPGRTRLPGHPSDPELVQRERALSYRYAASMLLPPAGAAAQRLPLLIKPLAVSAGGASHKGIDVFKRNVFQSTSDPRYLTLWRWAETRFAAPVVTPPAAAGGGAPPTDLGAAGAGAPQAADVGPPLVAAGATAPGMPPPVGGSGAPTGSLPAASPGPSGAGQP